MGESLEGKDRRPSGIGRVSSLRATIGCWERLKAKDEMVKEHHPLSGHKFEQTQGDSELEDRTGWWSLVCFSPRGGHDLVTEQQRVPVRNSEGPASQDFCGTQMRSVCIPLERRVTLGLTNPAFFNILVSSEDSTEIFYLWVRDWVSNRDNFPLTLI